MNQTMRIEPSSLEGKKALAVGYKIFDWNWGAKGGYCYADKNGEVEGSVHTVTGPLDECGLSTLGEAILNVELHAPGLFPYEKMHDELNELYQEAAVYDDNQLISDVLISNEVE